MAFRFDLSSDEERKLLAWFKTKDMSKPQGTIGGRFTYMFTPCSLGLIVRVVDNLENDEIDLTNYTTW